MATASKEKLTWPERLPKEIFEMILDHLQGTYENRYTISCISALRLSCKALAYGLAPYLAKQLFPIQVEMSEDGLRDFELIASMTLAPFIRELVIRSNTAPSEVITYDMRSLESSKQRDSLVLQAEKSPQQRADAMELAVLGLFASSDWDYDQEQEIRDKANDLDYIIDYRNATCAEYAIHCPTTGNSARLSKILEKFTGVQSIKTEFGYGYRVHVVRDQVGQDILNEIEDKSACGWSAVSPTCNCNQLLCHETYELPLHPFCLLAESAHIGSLPTTFLANLSVLEVDLWRLETRRYRDSESHPNDIMADVNLIASGVAQCKNIKTLCLRSEVDDRFPKYDSASMVIQRLQEHHQDWCPPLSHISLWGVHLDAPGVLDFLKKHPITTLELSFVSLESTELTAGQVLRILTLIRKSKAFNKLINHVIDSMPDGAQSDSRHHGWPEFSSNDPLAYKDMSIFLEKWIRIMQDQ